MEIRWGTGTKACAMCEEGGGRPLVQGTDWWVLLDTQVRPSHPSLGTSALLRDI